MKVKRLKFRDDPLTNIINLKLPLKQTYNYTNLKIKQITYLRYALKLIYHFNIKKAGILLIGKVCSTIFSNEKYTQETSLYLSSPSSTANIPKYKLKRSKLIISENSTYNDDISLIVKQKIPRIVLNNANALKDPINKGVLVLSIVQQKLVVLLTFLILKKKLKFNNFSKFKFLQSLCDE